MNSYNEEAENSSSGSWPAGLKDAGVLVVGGTSGLGAAAAAAFARHGARVVVAGRNREAGERIAAQISGRFAAVDVTDEEMVNNAVRMAAQAPRGLRVALNAAGSAIVAKTIDKNAPHDMADFVQLINTNLVGSFNLLRLAAAQMAHNEPEPAGRGVIALTSSVAAFEGQRGQVAYAAAKGGINSMVLPAARDLARDQIRVFGVAPGVFDTPFMDVLSAEAKDAVGKAVPFPQRLGLPEEYAQLVLSLAVNPMINGEVVRLDGALRLG